MEIRIGGGSLNNLEILMGGEAQAVLKFQVEVGGGEGVSKNSLSSWGYEFFLEKPHGPNYEGVELSDHAFSPMCQSYAKI